MPALHDTPAPVKMTILRYLLEDRSDAKCWIAGGGGGGGDVGTISEEDAVRETVRRFSVRLVMLLSSLLLLVSTLVVVVLLLCLSLLFLFIECDVVAVVCCLSWVLLVSAELSLHFDWGSLLPFDAVVAGETTISSPGGELLFAFAMVS